MKRRYKPTASAPRRGLMGGVLSLVLLLAGALVAVPPVDAASQFSWIQLSPITSPSDRYGASMGYDTATNQLLLFGGYDGTNYLDDSWSWNGSGWTQVGSSGPSARYGASLAYDPGTNQLLLFGGLNNGSALGDTWSWNGSTWTQLSPSTSPPARYGASMAYDPTTNRVLLFGGDNGGDLGDTWSWNGSPGLSSVRAPVPPPGGVRA